MKLTYIGTETRILDIKTPAEFYPTVAQEIIRAETGKSLIVRAETQDGYVTYKVGMRSGTQTIFEQKNTLPKEYLSALKPAYLTCVEPEVIAYLQHLQSHPAEFCPDTFGKEITKRCKNSYKQYKLVPSGDHVIAYYGRMAVQKGEIFGERSTKYPISSYWSKYFEKVGKGYVDRTAVYMPNGIVAENSPVEAVSQVAPKATASQNLFERLKTLAKRALIKADVKVPITPEIIEASRTQIDIMRKAAEVGDIVSFDLALLDIISMLQRPVVTGDGSGVRKMMAIRPDDFASILEREEDILQAMEGSIVGNGTATTQAKDNFGSYGIKVYNATAEQRAMVLRHLSPTLKNKVKAVYRVIPVKQKTIFDTYVARHRIKDIKMLWHGSRNENWMSIIRNSLMLNPNAVITGKMFGHGIYFALSSRKSWGYTSFKGTAWAQGTSNCAYMGLYAVAYGKPYDVTAWSPSVNYQILVAKNGCNSLHAHAGASLQADEIVLYDEAAVLLSYIVEFGE